MMRWLLAALVLCVIAIYEPVHAFLHRHLEFLCGVVLGTFAQSVPWLVERWKLRKGKR